MLRRSAASVAHRLLPFWAHSLRIAVCLTANPILEPSDRGWLAINSDMGNLEDVGTHSVTWRSPVSRRSRGAWGRCFGDTHHTHTHITRTFLLGGHGWTWFASHEDIWIIDTAVALGEEAVCIYRKQLGRSEAARGV